MWGRIEDAFSREGRELKIDVIIQNHIETDHSGALVEIHKKFPEAPIYCTKIAMNVLKNITLHWWMLISEQLKQDTCLISKIDSLHSLMPRCCIGQIVCSHYLWMKDIIL